MDCSWLSASRFGPLPVEVGARSEFSGVPLVAGKLALHHGPAKCILQLDPEDHREGTPSEKVFNGPNAISTDSGM